MEAVRKLLGHLATRLLAWLQTSDPATLQLTGILGLALVLIGYYHLKGSDNNNPSQQQQQRQEELRRQAQEAARRQAAPSRPVLAAAAQGSEAGPSGISHSQQAAAKATPRSAVVRDTPVARAVASKLQGVRRITVSCPGVLLQQWQPGQLTEQATLWPGVAEVVQEMAHVADVYLIGQVADDIGQALVSGALEAAGVTGNKPGQVPPHRLLLCSTQEGKVAIARQLEAELHIDSAHTTVDQLQRFVPQLLFVRQPAGPDASHASNVARSSSLADFFGL